MNYIKTYKKDSEEYSVLQMVASALNVVMGANNMPTRYTVEDTYFDFGQDWKWTTLIAHNMDLDSNDVLASWQAIYPAMQEQILTTSIENIFDECVKPIAQKELDKALTRR